MKIYLISKIENNNNKLKFKFWNCRIFLKQLSSYNMILIATAITYISLENS